MSDRIAPSKGYDFKNKMIYRMKIWSCFAESIDDTEVAKVGFFPSREGLEIPIALSLGFKEENLYAIDKTPQLLANAKWRKKHPLVHVYGSEAEVAGKRMFEDNVQLDAINIDLCGTLGYPMIRAMKGIADSGCLSRSSYVAITLLKGRERTEAVNIISAITGTSCDSIDRLDMMSKICFDYSVEVVRGDYMSTGGSRMLWSVNKVVETNEVGRLKENTPVFREIKPQNKKKRRTPVIFDDTIIAVNGVKKTVRKWRTINSISLALVRKRINACGFSQERAVSTKLLPKVGTKPADMLTVQGKTRSVKGWSLVVGLSEATLRKRLKDGWSNEESVTTPKFKAKGIYKIKG